MSPNRLDAQRDFEHRRTIGLVADVAFIGAAALAVVSGQFFIRYREQIFHGEGGN